MSGNENKTLIEAMDEEPQLDEGRYMSLCGISKSGKLNFEGKCTFIESLMKLHNVSAACRAMGVSKTAAYKQKRNDPEFSQAWDDAIEEGVDNLIQEGQRRAYEGVTEPVYQGGEKVGSKQKFSDVLLMFLVKAKRPEYRDNKQIALSGRVDSTNFNINSETSPEEAAKAYQEMIRQGKEE